MLTLQNILDLSFKDPLHASHGFLYALIDHGGMPGLAKKLAQTRVEYLSLFANSRDEGALAVAPLLFKIDTRSDSYQQQALLRWIGEQGTYSSSVLFMVSPFSLPELALRLAARLDASLPDDMDVVLRFFDTRTFEELMTVLSAQQKNAFLCVADCWWFVDRKGDLQRVAATFTEIDSHDIPLKLTQEQEGYLIQASEPDQVADLLLSGLPQQYDKLSPIVRHDFIMRRISAARLVGIQAIHELSLYCALALLYGENFASQPHWLVALSIVKSGEQSLAQAVEQVEAENELEEIA